MRNRTWFAVAASAAAVLIAFNSLTAQSQVRKTADAPHTDGGHGADNAKVTAAVAVVHALGDNKVKGKVTFTQKDGGVEILAELTGLTRASTASTFMNSAIARWPTANARAAISTPPVRHTAAPIVRSATSATSATSRPAKTARRPTSVSIKMIALHGPNSVIGRSVIIHAKADDMKTQPTGDAGDRVGCGTIGIADPKMLMAH